MTLGAPLLRGVIGALFVGHGTQKLFGWFDGPGLQGVSDNLVLIAALTALADHGPGPLSVDGDRFTRETEAVPA
jgi:uncharacterized membrane protein YphA (DoxX/SURF4 family)